MSTGRDSLASALVDALDDAALDRLADLLGERLVARSDATAAEDGWLDTKGAAAHLACKPDRVHDLVALGKLRPRRDGRRLLFKRSELDAYVERP